MNVQSENTEYEYTEYEYMEYIDQIYSGRASVGLIKGRHEMPVGAYLLEADVTRHVGFHQELYSAAYVAALELGSSEMLPVDLYITGLSIAAIGAIDGLREARKSFRIANYDTSTNTYVFVEVNDV